MVYNECIYVSQPCFRAMRKNESGDKPMKKYILALDEGTTSVRAILFNRQAEVVACVQHPFAQIYPQPGWVEQDPMEIYANQYAAMTECIAKSGIAPDEIAAIGITNQRETTVVWDKHTGKPVYHAIVWQCRRTAGICEQIVADGMEDYIRSVTGLRADAYFSATKIKWILDSSETLRSRAINGELLFGTVDTWLLWKLTDGRVHITDRTNASRTMLYDLRRGCWDQKLLDYFGISASMLPEIRSSSEVYTLINVMGADIPVSGMAGDQQAALFGQGCFSPGEIKTTYGTGCFLLEHTGQEPVRSSNGLVTTAAAAEKGKPFEYALEGSVFIGGAVMQWLRDGMGLLRDVGDSEYFARKTEDSGGVYIVPAFTGLGAPYWNMHSKGVITGLTRGTRPEHLIRASLESIAYQTNDLIMAMESDSGRKIRRMKADGGAAANDLLMQFQADISDLEVIRPLSNEATAAGAAFLAGLAVGFYQNREELLTLCRSGGQFIPEMDASQREDCLKGWKKAVRSAIVNGE